MTVLELGSADDERLDPYRDLKGSSEFGAEHFIVEGEHLVERLLSSSLEVVSVLVSSRKINKLRSLFPASVLVFVLDDDEIETELNSAIDNFKKNNKIRIKNNIVAVINARMTSTRLPGKSLLPLGNKSSLERHVERVRTCDQIDRIYLATTRAPDNDELVGEALRLGIDVYRGEDEDIVERYEKIATLAGADALIRIGCDKPLFCFDILRETVANYDGEDYLIMKESDILAIIG